MQSSAAIELPAPATMAQWLATQTPGFVAADWVNEIASTNTSLLTLAREQGLRARWPRLLGAHHQTQGKGRLGRTWLDRPGKTLMFSAGFALPTSQTPNSLQGLGPAIGMSSGFALRTLLLEPLRLRVKWPNDLMLDDGKCAGILIELAVKANTRFVVIGMGLNLSGHDSLKTELNREVADIGAHLLPHVNAWDLVTSLANTWQQTLSRVDQEGFAPYQENYAHIDYLAGQAIDLIDQGQIVETGVMAGLGTDGSLVLQTAAGLKTFQAGDVSVRLN